MHKKRARLLAPLKHWREKLSGSNAHSCAASLLKILHLAISQREQREILTTTNVVARANLGASLANQNVAGDNSFATVLFHAEALGIGIATIAG